MLCPTKRVWTLLIFSLVLIIHCLSLHSLLCLLVTNWFKTWRFIIEVNILGTLLCPVFSRKSCQLYRHCLKTCTPLASSMVLGDKIIAKFIKAQWRKKVNKWQTLLGWTTFPGRKCMYQLQGKAGIDRSRSRRQWSFSLCVWQILQTSKIVFTFSPGGNSYCP